MGDLTVTLHGQKIGLLSDRGPDFDFIPDPDAIRRHGLNSRVLSVAIPLVPRPAPSRRLVRQNFFAELLPEGDARQRLAREAGIRDGNDVIAMLRAYGRDVAGAIQIWDPEVPGEPRTADIEPLDDAGVAAALRDVVVTPLGNKPRRGKTSLNGVQDKIVLVRMDTGWARALDGYPSTHILKPVVAKYPSMIFDEEYASRFARALRLADFSTALKVFAGVPALVIERYDRSPDAVERRIHQEDFNQALGCRGDEKYEVFGGRGLGDVAKLLPQEGRVKLLRMVTLSVALGNLDMHLKNISLLHDADGDNRLAPMYDVVPQNFPDYDNDGEVALSVGGQFEYAAVHRGLLVGEGETWGLRMADELVDMTLQRIAAVATEQRPHPAAHPGLQADVQRVTANLIAGLTVTGEDPGHAPPPDGAGRAQRRSGGAWTWDNAVPTRSPRR